jgi:hypothetical protein
MGNSSIAHAGTVGAGAPTYPDKVTHREEGKALIEANFQVSPRVRPACPQQFSQPWDMVLA